jgi:hypothetical protein
MNRQVLEIANFCQSIGYAAALLSQAIGNLHNIDNSDETINYLTNMIDELEKIGAGMGERGEALMTKESDRCAGCPGTEGGCCR